MVFLNYYFFFYIYNIVNFNHFHLFYINKRNTNLLVFIAKLAFILVPKMSAVSQVTVHLKLTDRTEKSRTYTLEFTNSCFKLVCQVKFRVQLPKTTTLASHWGIVPVSDGTGDQQNLFILPSNVHLHPGQSFSAAGISVNGADCPQIAILDVTSVLCTERPTADGDN